MNKQPSTDELMSAAPQDEHRRQILRMLPAPEPAGGSDYYHRERELSLAFDSRRSENYQRYKRWRAQGGPVDYLPIKLDIENVSRCNFRCQMCVVSDWHKGKRGEDMTLDAFQKLIDEQYGLIEIKLQGIGEPLMMGDDYFAMIRYARLKKIWVRSTTNASLLHLKNNYKKVVDSDINELQISIDGADRQTFEKIRRGSQFGRVASNCKLVNQYSRDVGRIRTKMWTVVQRDNEHQLEQFVDFASELGFTNQVFMINLIDWGLDAWHQRNADITVENEINPDRLLKLVERGDRLGVSVRFWSASDKYLPGRRETLCPWPFERAYVSSDMRVVPCCMIGNPDVFEIGSGIGAKGSLTDVWHSESYETFRQSHIKGDIPKVCLNCYHAKEHWGSFPPA